MELTGWVEPDQVAWRGIRWARRGNLLVKYAEIINGAYLMYTVPADRTFYLVGSVLCPTTFANGVGRGWIRDDSDYIWFSLGFCDADDARGSSNIAFQPSAPLEVPAGYDFVVYSDRAGYTASLSFYGWEE